MRMEDRIQRKWRRIKREAGRAHRKCKSAILWTDTWAKGAKNKRIYHVFAYFDLNRIFCCCYCVRSLFVGDMQFSWLWSWLVIFDIFVYDSIIAPHTHQLTPVMFCHFFRFRLRYLAQETSTAICPVTISRTPFRIMYNVDTLGSRRARLAHFHERLSGQGSITKVEYE